MRIAFYGVYTKRDLRSPARVAFQLFTMVLQPHWFGTVVTFAHCAPSSGLQLVAACRIKNAGREWQPEGEPELVDVHDFPGDAVGKAIPYGVYDVASNAGFVSVGVDHDTPVFAVTSIEAWWKQVGQQRYPKARELFITADAGGSNSYRSHVWKDQLQRLADKLALAIHLSHFPPGTSKWNKVEHRLFAPASG
jgi:hypothetical protein